MSTRQEALGNIKIKLIVYCGMSITCADPVNLNHPIIVTHYCNCLGDAVLFVDRTAQWLVHSLSFILSPSYLLRGWTLLYLLHLLLGLTSVTMRARISLGTSVHCSSISQSIHVPLHVPLRHRQCKLRQRSVSAYNLVSIQPLQSVCMRTV